LKIENAVDFISIAVDFISAESFFIRMSVHLISAEIFFLAIAVFFYPPYGGGNCSRRCKKQCPFTPEA
jgi:hypothetical protein